MKKLKRPYIYEKDYEEIFKWAYMLWEKERVRAPNGRPIYTSFPYSLKKYIEWLKNDQL